MFSIKNWNGKWKEKNIVCDNEQRKDVGLGVKFKQKFCRRAFEFAWTFLVLHKRLCFLTPSWFEYEKTRVSKSDESYDFEIRSFRVGATKKAMQRARTRPLNADVLPFCII